jgi:hypothetical protein
VIDLYKFLASDNQDSVRLHVIEVAAALAASFVKNKSTEQSKELSISIVKPVLLGMIHYSLLS